MAKVEAGGPAADSRELILRAALKAFAQRGFGGATTREIAADAGVNHGLIPYYFGGKDKLWRAAVDLAFSELAEAFADIQDDPEITDTRERTRLLIRNFVRFVARHPEFIQLMNDEGKRRGPRMRWIVDHHVAPLFESVSSLIELSQQRGEMPSDIPPIHFHYILAGAVGLFFSQAEECKRLSGLDPLQEEAIETHARAVEHFLLGSSQEESAR